MLGESVTLFILIHEHCESVGGEKWKHFFFLLMKEKNTSHWLYISFFFSSSYYRSPSWSRKCRMKNVFVSPGMAQWQKKENRFLKFLLHEHFRLLGPTRRNWKKKHLIFNNSIVFHHSEVRESERSVGRVIKRIAQTSDFSFLTFSCFILKDGTTIPNDCVQLYVQRHTLLVRWLDFTITKDKKKLINKKKKFLVFYLRSLGCVKKENRKRSKPEAKNWEMLAPFVQVVDEKLEQLYGIRINHIVSRKQLRRNNVQNMQRYPQFVQK
jgi:hypothetical protein